MFGFLGFASATAAKKGFPAKMRPLMGCFGWGIKWFPLLYIFGDVDNGKMGSCQNMPPKVLPFKGSSVKTWQHLIQSPFKSVPEPPEAHPKPIVECPKQRAP